MSLDFDQEGGSLQPVFDPQSTSGRLRGLLPPWFPSVSPILGATLAGVSGSLVFGQQIIEFARSQTRISTANGAWLDIVAWDFLDSRFQRWFGEDNFRFANRVKAEITRPRSTKAAISRAVTELVGTPPSMWEAWNPGDCGAYDVGVCGYDVAGRLGSYDINQIFVQVKRPIGQGIPFASGYDRTGGGYDVGSIEYTEEPQTLGAIRDKDIYANVAATIAAGTIAWVQIGTETSPIVDSPPDEDAVFAWFMGAGIVAGSQPTTVAASEEGSSEDLFFIL